MFDSPAIETLTRQIEQLREESTRLRAELERLNEAERSASEEYSRGNAELLTKQHCELSSLQRKEKIGREKLERTKERMNTAKSLLEAAGDWVRHVESGQRQAMENSERWKRLVGQTNKNVEFLKHLIATKSIPGSGWVAFHSRGNTKYEMKDYVGAILDYKHCFELGGGMTPNYGTLYMMGRTYFAMGRYEEALVAANAGVAQTQDAGRFASRAEIKFALADFDGASEDCEACLKLDPHNKEASIMLSRVASKSRKISKNPADIRRIWKKREELAQEALSSSRKSFDSAQRDFSKTQEEYQAIPRALESCTREVERLQSDVDGMRSKLESIREEKQQIETRVHDIEMRELPDAEQQLAEEISASAMMLSSEDFQSEFTEASHEAPVRLELTDADLDRLVSLMTTGDVPAAASSSGGDTLTDDDLDRLAAQLGK